MATITNAADAFEGIYAQSNPLFSTRQALSDAVYASDAVKGVSLNLIWDAIEPEKGVYNWATLDNEVMRALASGKEISLTVTPNRPDAPSWLFEAGAQQLDFTITQHGGVRPQDVSLAAPWDPVFQTEYANMMNALADHLKSIPGAYQAVSIVKITGIGEVTSELKLPTKADDPGATEAWLAAGYTPEKVIQAWKDFATATNNAFSDKILAIAATEKNGFPLIDNNGNEISAKSPAYVDVVKEIVAAGLDMFGERFMVTWAGLGSGKLSAVVNEAIKDGAHAGYQTNHFLTSGVGVGMYGDAVAPTDASYLALLKQGIEKGGAEYFEVWASDLLKFDSAVSTASSLITGGGAAAAQAAAAGPTMFTMHAGDVVTGTERADTFMFKSIMDARIKMFDQGTDKIDLSKIDADSHTDGNQNFAFIGDAAFTGHAGELHFTSTKNLTILSGDVDGDGKADFSIELAGQIDLKKTDIVGAYKGEVAPVPSVIDLSAGQIVKGTAQSDTFVFNRLEDSPTSDASRIKNFVQGSDIIDLHTVDANQQLAGNQKFTFLGEGAFTGHAGELHQTYTANLTLVTGDVNGDGKADFTIQVAGHVQFTANDFIL